MEFTLTTEEQSAFDTVGANATTLLNNKVEEIVNQAKKRRADTLATDIIALPEGSAKNKIIADVEALKGEVEGEVIQ